MEKDSDLLNKKKTVQISVTDKDGKEHPIDVETEILITQPRPTSPA